jgi:hypothetical protein
MVIRLWKLILREDKKITQWLRFIDLDFDAWLTDGIFSPKIFERITFHLFLISIIFESISTLLRPCILIFVCHHRISLLKGHFSMWGGREIKSHPPWQLGHMKIQLLSFLVWFINAIASVWRSAFSHCTPHLSHKLSVCKHSAEILLSTSLYFNEI